MLKIYIARHGQNEDNANGILNGHRDKPLTKIGIEQAEELAEKIKKSGIILDKIYSSPLDRAYKTAEIISDKLGVDKPVKLDLLIERDFGVMTGVKTSEIKERCKPDIIETEHVTYFLSPEGAETFPELLERGKKILNLVKKENNNGSILLVCHGDIGKMIYAVYYNLGWRKVLTMFNFGNSELLLLSNDSSVLNSHVFNIK